MIVRRWFKSACACAAALGVAAGSAGPARAQVAAVTVKSASALIEQARALAGSLDPDAARPLLDALDQADDPAALNGLDRTKPITAFADMPEGGPPSAALFVPVTSAADFFTSLGRLGVMVDDNPGVAGFTHKITVPGVAMPPLYVLTTPGHVVATTAPAGADRLKAVKPAELTPARPAGLIATVRLDRLPAAVKQSFLDNLERNAGQQRERKPGEDEPTYKGRLAGFQLVQDAVVALTRDGRELGLDVDVDPKLGRLSVALGADARPGSPLAGSLESFGKRRSKFAALAPGAAASLRGVLPLPEAVRGLIREGLKSARGQAADDKDAEARRVKNLMLDAVEPTLTGPELDAIVVVEVDENDKAKDSDDAADVLFGAAVKDSSKIEAALREAVAKSDPKDRGKVAFDFARGGDGTPIHKVTLDKKDFKAEQLGEPLMFLAFPEGAVLAVVGGEGLGSLKGALEALKKPAGKPGPQVALDLAAVASAKLNKDLDKGQVRAAARDAFEGPKAGKDHVRLGLTGGPDGARLRLDADLPVLRFFTRLGDKKAGK